jgi:hypothetical protein
MSTYGCRTLVIGGNEGEDHEHTPVGVTRSPQVLTHGIVEIPELVTKDRRQDPDAPECDRRQSDEDNSRKLKRVALVIATRPSLMLPRYPSSSLCRLDQPDDECDECGGHEQRATSGELRAGRGLVGPAGRGY